MKIIGINHDMHISSAALLEDGKIVAAAAEERFTRQKRTKAFPRSAMEFCMRYAGCELEDIDCIVSSFNPGVLLKKFNPLFSSQRRHFAEHLYSIPDNIAAMYKGRVGDCEFIKQEVSFGEKTCSMYYLTHHRAHAANAYYNSPFDEAAILTLDSQGERESATFAYASGNNIRVLASIDYPHSLGAFYSSITSFLGFRPNSDEWKVMALASYSEWDNEYYDFFTRDLISLLPNGRFELDLSYITGYLHEQPGLYSGKLVQKLGADRDADDPLEDRHYRIAAALQKTTEDIVVHLLEHLHSLTHSDNLVVAGGSFMNSVLNGKLHRISPFQHISIPCCPDDSGNAIGAAQYLYANVLGKGKAIPISSSFLGPEYSNSDIELALSKYKIRAVFEESVEKVCAQLLADGNLIGWFQGRMEFGQRALGNRSIIADPRSQSMKDRINLSVKYRENFRPFAPAILKEHTQAYFDIPEGVEVPYMEKVFQIRTDKQAAIPAVVHVDGSGRLQTVDAVLSPRFYALIDRFRELTGVPVVLNTSFNVNGEPIVCSPEDALRTFYNSGLDYLILGNYVVRK